jgi:hypothetical protein
MFVLPKISRKIGPFGGQSQCCQADRGLRINMLLKLRNSEARQQYGVFTLARELKDYIK